MTLAARAYRALGRIVPCDVTAVLVLESRRLPPAPEVEPAGVASPTLHLLDEAETRSRAAAGWPGFDAAMPVVRTGEGGRCAVAVHGRALVAHTWFARGAVPAALNTGGNRFAGIGLRLPPAAAYLYKVHVAPERRGHGLAAALIAHGVRALSGPDVRHVVTTTDVTNTAFRRNASRLGFERRDWAAEIVVGGRPLRRVPRPLRLSDGAQIVFFAGAER